MFSWYFPGVSPPCVSLAFSALSLCVHIKCLWYSRSFPMCCGCRSCPRVNMKNNVRKTTVKVDHFRSRKLCFFHIYKVVPAVFWYFCTSIKYIFSTLKHGQTISYIFWGLLLGSRVCGYAMRPVFSGSRLRYTMDFEHFLLGVRNVWDKLQASVSDRNVVVFFVGDCWRFRVPRNWGSGISRMGNSYPYGPFIALTYRLAHRKWWFSNIVMLVYHKVMYVGIWKGTCTKSSWKVGCWRFWENLGYCLDQGLAEFGSSSNRVGRNWIIGFQVLPHSLIEGKERYVFIIHTCVYR